MGTYNHHAYHRATTARLQQFLLDNYVASDTPPSGEIICDEVFRSDSVVPQEELMSYMEMLQRIEAFHRGKMNEYKFVRQGKPEDDFPFLDDEKAPDEKPAPRATAASKRRRGAKKNKP
jgi:hypothetical protein